MITSISSTATGTVTIDISGAPVLRFTNTFIMKPNLFTGCILTSNHSYFLLVVVHGIGISQTHHISIVTSSTNITNIIIGITNIITLYTPVIPLKLPPYRWICCELSRWVELSTTILPRLVKFVGPYGVLARTGIKLV